MSLIAVPITLRQANDYVSAFHRHNGRTNRDGGKFAIGCSDGQGLVGVAIVGHPIARLLDDGWTAEVLRTCSAPDAPKNVNSFFVRLLLAGVARNGRSSADHIYAHDRERRIAAWCRMADRS